MAEPHKHEGWRRQLAAGLEALAERSMLRSLRPVDRCGRLVRREGGERSLINLSSNDYLALADHARLRDAVCDAAQRYGVGSGASRLVTGDLALHHEIESRFAEFKHAEAALILPTGFTANLALLGALAGPDDAVLMDKLNHASLIDAGRSCGATVRVYPHRNLEKLERLLERSASARRRLIVTDSVFSMDGDAADLPALCELRDRYDAILIVDEAHATGVLGESGSGLAELQGVAGRIDATVSTASKALGSLGGVITGDQLVIDTVVNSGRAFIYTTGVPPTQAAAIGAALDVVRDEPDRRVRLGELNLMMRAMLRENGWPIADDFSPIIPIIVGDEKRAMGHAARLEQAGFCVPAIRPPTVAPGACRLRVSLRCDLTDADVSGFVAALGPARQ